jgi:hypothetical protein
MAVVYRFAKRLSAALVGLSSQYGVQLWSAITLRKSKACFVCEIVMPRGAPAYRPITNGDNRMDRLCVRCVEHLESAPTPNDLG